MKKKLFNVAGPCLADKHYTLPSLNRCEGVLRLIDEEQYFVIHAARQTGKTTLLFDLVRHLNDSGDYYALYCSLEGIQNVNEVEKGIPAIVWCIQKYVGISKVLKGHEFAEDANLHNIYNVVQIELSRFCEKLDRPLVVLFDEVDCLSNGVLISFLRQLREGFINRGVAPFVHSLALVGMRNIRDYKSKIREERQTLGSASPFNIVKKSKTLLNFSNDEISTLTAQHAQQTGQEFPPEVVERIGFYTQGQPWLVNAIACEIVEEILMDDYSKGIEVEYVEQAVQTLIQRRDTHVDSLLERLKEERVRKIVEPLIIGKSADFGPLDDDYQFVIDLGLLQKHQEKLVPANPIYAEIIIRYLSINYQTRMDEIQHPPKSSAYLSGGRLDMKRLLGDFQGFWRKNSEVWCELYFYKEAAPHLILQAFLQRIINLGGTITREMAAGTKRLDLCVHFQETDYPIELKLKYSEKTYREGEEQLATYMDKLGCAEGWLIVFDRNKDVPWEERIFWKKQELNGLTINIVGC